LIQVALDLIDIKDAIDIASKVLDYVDYIEAGTPLIKTLGLKSVELLKKNFGDKVVVADMKTMDTGYLEASLAYKYGADYSTVMGLADEDTIKASIDAAREFSKGIMVDLMGVKSMNLVKKIDEFRPDYMIIHSGIDMQHKGVTPFEFLGKVVEAGLSSRLAVAGGINPDNLIRLSKYRVELIIVGGYITKSSDPARAAETLFDKVEELFDG